MIGALAIKNRRKKLAGGQNLASQNSTEREVISFTSRCHFLYISSGVCLLIGVIVLIPGLFGNETFFIYSGSFAGAGLILFLLACLLHSDAPRGLPGNIPTPPGQPGMPGNLGNVGSLGAAVGNVGNIAIPNSTVLEMSAPEVPAGQGQFLEVNTGVTGLTGHTSVSSNHLPSVAAS